MTSDLLPFFTLLTDMNHTIKHLRRVADLVATVDIDAVLATVSLENHESESLTLEFYAAAMKLQRVAAIVELLADAEATDGV
jgi:hypothetical protein